MLKYGPKGCLLFKGTETIVPLPKYEDRYSINTPDEKLLEVQLRIWAIRNVEQWTRNTFFDYLLLQGAWIDGIPVFTDKPFRDPNIFTSRQLKFVRRSI